MHRRRSRGGGGRGSYSHPLLHKIKQKCLSCLQNNLARVCVAYFDRFTGAFPAGFRLPIFLSILLIYIEPKTHWIRRTGQNTPHGSQRGPFTESREEGGSLAEQSEQWALMTSPYCDDASKKKTKWRTASMCADVRV